MEIRLKRHLKTRFFESQRTDPVTLAGMLQVLAHITSQSYAWNVSAFFVNIKDQFTTNAARIIQDSHSKFVAQIKLTDSGFAFANARILVKKFTSPVLLHITLFA